MREADDLADRPLVVAVCLLAVWCQHYLGMRVQRFEDLPFSTIAREFVGSEHGAGVTFLLVDAPPGAGPRLHQHPYEEIFIVQEGEATFRGEDGERVVRAGEIVVVAAREPHAFTNTGAGQLRQIDIHASPRFATEWLEP